MFFSHQYHLHQHVHNCELYSFGVFSLLEPLPAPSQGSSEHRCSVQRRRRTCGQICVSTSPWQVKWRSIEASSIKHFVAISGQGSSRIYCSMLFDNFAASAAVSDFFAAKRAAMLVPVPTAKWSKIQDARSREAGVRSQEISQAGENVRYQGRRGECLTLNTINSSSLAPVKANLLSVVVRSGSAVSS